MSRIRAKGWFLTWPRLECSKDFVRDYFKKESIVEYVIASEKHADGVGHIHAFMKYKTKIEWKSDKWDIKYDGDVYHGNYQVAKSWKAVEAYCKKDGDFLASFEVDVARAKKRKLNEEIIEKDVVSLVDQGVIGIMDIKKCMEAKNIYTLTKQKADSSDRVQENLWLCAQSGEGKSYWAFQKYPDAYRKAQNKWWDGYTGQETVIMDDLDKLASGLSHYMKIWCDNYPCSGEIKGGTVPLLHKRVVVTSQYKPEEIWDDPKVVEAISRRFKIINFVRHYQN